MIERFVVLLMCHMIGDYVLQNSYIAASKANNWYHMFVHCILYIVPFYVCFGFVWKLAAIFVVPLSVDVLKVKGILLRNKRRIKICYWQDQMIHCLVLFLYFL